MCFVIVVVMSLPDSTVVFDRIVVLVSAFLMIMCLVVRVLCSVRSYGPGRLLLLMKVWCKCYRLLLVKNMLRIGGRLLLLVV